MSVKHDFPFKLHFVPFTSCAHFPTNCEGKPQQHQKKPRNIIIGGYTSIDGGFYEIIVNDEANCINYRSFQNDYGKKFSNLKHIGLDAAANSHSYLVENDKYIVVFKDNACYNVYDIEHDKWLINDEDGKDTGLKWNNTRTRSILINDEVIIISNAEKFYFYYIGKDHITNPIFMHEYSLKTQDVAFLNHNMCLIAFTKHTKRAKDRKEKYNKDDDDDESHDTYKLKILVFGGHMNTDSLSSFLFVDILLSYSFVGDKRYSQLVSVDEHLIDKSSIKLNNVSLDEITGKWDGYHCGSTCVLDSKNEAIIVIVGGKFGTMERDIHLFNCVTHELTRKEQV